MSNKIIGIPGYKGTDSNNFGVGNHYLTFCQKLGYNPRIIMPWEEYVEVDMLLLPGGMDTAPSNYGQIPDFLAGNQDVFKEFFFKERLKEYVDREIPILGICLGMQQLAAYFGTPLMQHLIYHEQSSKRFETAHPVYFCTEQVLSTSEVPSKLRAINGFEVNSHHHQGVNLTDLSEELVPLVVAPLYGIDTKRGHGGNLIVESFKHRHLPIIGIQWHPEELYDNFSIDMIDSLINKKELTLS